MSASRVSRRDFLKVTLSAAASAAIWGCSQWPAVEPKAKQLNVFNWADYLHPDAIPEFERRYGIRVVYDTFASNETLLARMQGGGSRYDIVVPTSYSVGYLGKLGLLSRLDKERLPNFKQIMNRLQDPAYDPGCRYSVPFMWGSTGIGYDRTAFASPADEPRDWQVFWNNRLAHRMTLLDDARETIGMALKRRGGSYNTTDEKHIRQAVGELIAQKPLTMAYTSDQVITQLAAGDSLLSMVYSGDA